MRDLQYITDRLLSMRDEAYRDFHARLIPTVDKSRIIGVRTPDLRRFARETARDKELTQLFIDDLPHPYYELNNLHGELLSLTVKDIDTMLAQLDRFLPYVDNWATCDMLPPKIFSRHATEAEAKIIEWLGSKHVYTVRFGVVSLLGFFLDEKFRPEHLQLLCRLHSDEYYINMATAWYFSFALIKQWDATLPLFERNELDKTVHNKAIQKAVESYRISPERKTLLRELRRK